MCQNAERHRGDSNPCGQSPMDFESISLTTRTHCLVGCCADKALRGAAPSPPAKSLRALGAVEQRPLRAAAYESKRRRGYQPPGPKCAAPRADRALCWAPPAARPTRIRACERLPGGLGGSAPGPLCQRRRPGSGSTTARNSSPGNRAGGRRKQEYRLAAQIDSEGIRTPAGRAQWISSPSP